MDTLNDYMAENDIPKLKDGLELLGLIGGVSKQYYAACYAIAKVMLQEESEKRRCVILHGLADTGKSHIAKLMYEIFDAHWKNETKGMYDERITDHEAHR